MHASILNLGEFRLTQAEKGTVAVTAWVCRGDHCDGAQRVEMTWQGSWGGSPMLTRTDVPATWTHGPPHSQAFSDGTDPGQPPKSTKWGTVLFCETLSVSSKKTK